MIWARFLGQFPKEGNDNERVITLWCFPRAKAKKGASEAGQDDTEKRRKEKSFRRDDDQVEEKENHQKKGTVQDGKTEMDGIRREEWETKEMAEMTERSNQTQRKLGRVAHPKD